MPTISIRVSTAEKASLDTSADILGVSVSEYIRASLRLRENTPDLERRLEDVEARLARLEEFAHVA